MKISARKFLIIFIVFMAVLFGMRFFDKTAVMHWISVIQNTHGIEAVILLSVIYLLNNIFILPFGLAINLLAGMLWGTLEGGILINILATFIAGVCFWVGRWFSDFFLRGYFQKYQSLIKLSNTINKYNWQFISLARINPIVPFGLSNYLFGTIPGLSFREYIITTAISNFIPCLVFASIGSVFKTITLEHSNTQQLILETGIALTLITSFFCIKVFLSKGESV